MTTAKKSSSRKPEVKRARRTPAKQRNTIVVDPAPTRVPAQFLGVRSEGGKTILSMAVPASIADQFSLAGVSIGPASVVAQQFEQAHQFADKAVRAYEPAPPPAVHRDSPLQNALGSLERRIEEMNCALGELEMAASSILIPTAPEVNSAGQPTGTAIVVSPSVEELHRLTSCLERLVNRVNYITGRVQA